jgi:hypothetical protein
MATNSFPSVNVTGPVHHYIQAPGQNSANIYYAGTAESTPQMQMRIYKKDVKNTIAAGTLPFQRTSDGEAATVSVLLNRFSQLALHIALLSDSTGGDLIPAVGSETRWNRGSLIFGQKTFQLWQVFDSFFAPGGVDVGENLPIGFYWPQVEILDHDTVAAGTMDEKILCVFDCTPFWTPYGVSTTLPGGPGGWMLYSQDQAYFPAAVTTSGAPQ